jgi:asparagine synthase (glutamine-hydrolysing)
MCGIAALIRLSESPLDAKVIEAMTTTVLHRGPDGQGVAYFTIQDNLRELSDGSSEPWRVALGHRRLSILDLSEAGAQPMAYRGRTWITYNGEVYNFVELRAELEGLGHHFQSHSDTEVILAAYEEWGTDCFKRFSGMWGLVLLDGQRRKAIISRDRLGIKPVYLWRGPGVLAIVSEIKQLLAIPTFRARANPDAIWEYVFSGYEENDRTFFAGVTPLPSGTWQEIDLETLATRSPQSYWHPEQIQPTEKDPHVAAESFRDQLTAATRIYLRSDVPVGCALSGGLDSSALAATMVAIDPTLKGGGTRSQLHTFSVIFPGHPKDESSFVNSVVKQLQLNSHVVTPTPDELIDDLERFVWVHDEPVGGLAQYAAYTVARLTRAEGVPVTLNGQGGDEVLGGYWQSYLVHLRKLFRGGRFGRLSQHVFGALLPGGNRELIRQFPVMLRRYRDRKTAGRETVSPFASTARELVQQKLARILSMTDQDRRIYEMRELHLPRLLRWDDRNFMAFSVEGRYPFLEHRLIELALSFAPEALYRRGWAKEPLRRGLADILPATIARRKTKFGFPTPQADWVVGPLRPMLQTFSFGDSPLWSYVEPSYVQRLFHTAMASDRRNENSVYELFRLFMLDRWMRQFSVDVQAIVC